MQSRNLDYYKRFTLQEYLRSYLSDSHGIYQHIIAHYEAGLLVGHSDISTILVIGCGFGREVDLLLRLYPDSKLVILDISNCFLDSLGSIYNTHRVRLVQRDLDAEQSLPFESSTFDLVVSFNTFEYLDSETTYPRILAESSRVLRHDGLLVSKYLNRDSLYGIIINWRASLRSSSQSQYYAKSYNATKLILEKSFSNTRFLLCDYSLFHPPLQFLYVDIFAYSTVILSRLILCIVPRRFVPYFYGVSRK